MYIYKKQFRGHYSLVDSEVDSEYNSSLSKYCNGYVKFELIVSYG